MDDNWEHMNKGAVYSIRAGGKKDNQYTIPADSGVNI